MFELDCIPRGVLTTMACIKTQYQEYLPPSYPRARRPALIPDNCSLTPAEAEELVRTRTQQPLFPCPDPRLFQDLRPESPLESDSSDTDSPKLESGKSQPQSPVRASAISKRRSSTPTSKVRDDRRRSTSLKARAHRLRDRNLQQLFPFSSGRTSITAEALVRQTCDNGYIIAPRPTSVPQLRKHSAFVIAEEEKLRLEARADTPHLSELLPGDDELPVLIMGKDRMLCGPDEDLTVALEGNKKL
jgi:hypothetical protein